MLLRTVPLRLSLCGTHSLPYQIKTLLQMFFFFPNIFPSYSLFIHRFYIHTKLNLRPSSAVFSVEASELCSQHFDLQVITSLSFSYIIILNDLLSPFLILSYAPSSSPIFSHRLFLLASPPLLSLFLPSIHVSVKYRIASCQTYRGHAVDLPYKNRCLNINCKISSVLHSCTSIKITLR